MRHPHLLMPLVVATMGLGSAAHAQTAQIPDPVCAIEIDGVSVATPVAQVRELWGRSGLPYTEEVGARAPGYPVLTQLRFNRDPQNPDRTAWGPLGFAYSSSTEGTVNLSRTETDTVRVIRKTGDRIEFWRLWSFADRVSARVAQFCNSGDARVSCQFEGTQIRYIRIVAPTDGTLPFCTYTLSLQGRGGQIYRSVVGETESDVVGDLQESVSLQVRPSKEQMRNQRGAPGRAPRP